MRINPKPLGFVGSIAELTNTMREQWSMLLAEYPKNARLVALKYPPVHPYRFDTEQQGGRYPVFILTYDTEAGSDKVSLSVASLVPTQDNAQVQVIRASGVDPSTLVPWEDNEYVTLVSDDDVDFV